MPDKAKWVTEWKQKAELFEVMFHGNVPYSLLAHISRQSAQKIFALKFKKKSIFP